MHHGFLLVEFALGPGLVRGGNHGGVRQSHREVEAHRLLFIGAHELNESAGVDVRPELTLVGFAALRGVDVGVLVSLVTWWVAGLIARPHRPVIKAVLLHRLRLDAEVVDLPLAGREGGITQVFHQAGEGGVLPLLPVKVANAPTWHVPVVHKAIAKRVLAGEQCRARGRALGHGVGVVELHAPRGECIDVRGFNILCAVATDPFLAEVIEHDEEDVGFFCLCLSLR